MPGSGPRIRDVQIHKRDHSLRNSQGRTWLPFLVRTVPDPAIKSEASWPGSALFSVVSDCMGQPALLSLNGHRALVQEPLWPVSPPKFPKDLHLLLEPCSELQGKKWIQDKNYKQKCINLKKNLSIKKKSESRPSP